MLRNAVAKAMHSQTYPPVEASVAKSSTTGQLDILQNAIEKADYSQMYPIEASVGQEEYYIMLTWHFTECNCEGSLQQMYCPWVEASGGEEEYYIRLTWQFTECNWEGSLQSDVPPW